MRERIDWGFVRLVLGLWAAGLLLGAVITLVAQVVPWWRWFY